MFDILIRGGRVVDGSGRPGYSADLGVRNGSIVAIEPKLRGDAVETIDASGQIVTPGFIDIHTHYDAQVSWDDALEPSASHGVTTAVMGNCGVGFAPCRRADRNLLIEIMEGVEDIPGTALHEGISWEWESFPDYLDALDSRRYALDIAAQIPHAPLRLYVMGDRGAANEEASAEDRDQMAKLVRGAMEAGAVGFSTSRVLEHQDVNGVAVPGTFAGAGELLALAEAVAASGHGLFQAVPAGVVGGHAMAESANLLLKDVELLAELARRTNVGVTFSLLQAHDSPENWRKAISICESATSVGGRIYPQVAARAPGTLSSFAGYHPFQRRETYLRIAHLPFGDRVAQLRRPEIRAAILTDRDIPPESKALMANRHLVMKRALPTQYVYGPEVDYEPLATLSIAALAASKGVGVEEYAYDALLAQEGRAFLFQLPLNYARGDYSAVAEMLRNPITLSGLSDAGAHVQVICDASMPTFSLAFWSRDRHRGEKIELEFMIKKQTADNAAAYGFADRGRLAVGLRADINVIDFERLALTPPVMAQDLPHGGKRLLQGARGYTATVVNGVVTRRNGTDTGARPGRLVRGH